MFDCKVQWIYSIGYAVRNDVVYPDISALGNGRTLVQLNYFSNKYSKLK